ncbi:MAG: hypothetical protein ACU0DK_14960 [Pseudooceanicola sp.]
MIRILSTPRIVQPRNGFFATLLQTLCNMARMIGDARRLDTLPRDRLDDMGIAPRNEANRRSNGEHGPISHATMW